ncbi:sushi, von Willebrand factor type A, EGF and pentraxin domain-containing protein 1-like isoform X1 [Dreissena polymorpha]|uniref:Sushi domain-containing protein n=1 Tax=Dreissena polymorpha TaxID=45954 RepID=A0A9D4R6J9_DREPO|nr:sushi, von Willebrand factor type A, EGF and pentraxin domain-containing protein 1-like isoform X1 [Dreissena polymorpha]KAH3855090.1 hypothetical protein DPMN_097650 [Dreissena polymorpha]
MELIVAFAFHCACLALTLADCPPPPAVQNAAFTPVQSSYADGANVTFTCNTGYGLQGSRIHYCRGSSWEGSLICYEQFCETMNNPRNGIIVGNPSYKIGTYITFQCNTGYTLKGNSQLLCRVDLKFDRNPPTCDVNMCPDFGVIDHARIFQATDGGIENDYGSLVKVTCEDSYVLDGHVSVVCQGDGTWGPKPTCKPLDCGRFDGMNSSCVKDFVLLDTLYYMECKTDVPNTRIGADSTSAPNECEARSRKWMYSLFGCFCNCQVIYNKTIVITYNLDPNDYLPHNTALMWSCRPGCRTNQTYALGCMDGQMEMPSCTCDSYAHTHETSFIIIIAAIIGAVVLALSVAVALVMYKKKEGCFKSGTNVEASYPMTKPTHDEGGNSSNGNTFKPSDKSHINLTKEEERLLSANKK